MKRVLLFVLLAFVMALPVMGQDEPQADTSDEVEVAPADTPQDNPPPADPLATNIEKVEGQVVVVKDKNGVESVTLKNADAELSLLACDQLTELLKVENLAGKTFVIEGEKVAGKDGMGGFMIKSFQEKVADVVPDAPPQE